MTGLGETAGYAAPKGNAKALRQKDRVATILWKVRSQAHTDGATAEGGGNLSGQSMEALTLIKGVLWLFLNF